MSHGSTVRLALVASGVAVMSLLGASAANASPSLSSSEPSQSIQVSTAAPHSCPWDRHDPRWRQHGCPWHDNDHRWRDHRGPRFR